MFKLVGGTALVAGVLYFGGVFDTGYTRVVARAPSEVAAAIEDLDITTAPGEPGTDPSRSGGIRPAVTVERLPDRVVWTVHSGDKVATRMIAFLEPIEDGKQTRVRAKVERGDAPDDLVSPAFRSESQTLALFSVVLEEELNHLTAAHAWNADCDAVIERYQDTAIDEMTGGRGPSAAHAPGLRGGMERVAKANIRINAIETDLRNAGCDPDANRGPFRAPVQHMKMESSMANADPNQSIQPMVDASKPMVDVSRR